MGEGSSTATPIDADLIRILAAPLRLRIVTLLAHETLCTSHLVAETGAKQTNLSNHLRVLREAGVVETEACGRYTYYRVKPHVLAQVAAQLSELAITADTTIETGRKRPW